MKRLGNLSLILFCIITLLLFVLSKKPTATVILASPLLGLGQIVGLIGTTLLALSFVLSARWWWLEPIFGGLDKVYRAHHIVGALAFLLLLNHPLFLILDRLPNMASSLPLIFGGGRLDYVTGVISLLLLGVLIVITLFVDLPYHLWKKTHEWMALPFGLGALHVLLIPSDVSRYFPLRIYLLALLGFGMASYIYKRFLYNWIGPKHDYVVDAIDRRGDFLNLLLKPIDSPLKFAPGQFAFLHMPKPLSDEHHPFSFAASHTDPNLSFAMKIVGDYTLALKDAIKGSVVTVFGPYGQFGDSFFSTKPVICIAGGIGITPFLSLLGAEISRQDSTRPVYMYYSVKTLEEAFAHEQLLTLASQSANIRYTLHASKLHGRLSAKIIAENVPEFKQAKIYLCGPLPMMQGLTAQLIALGIPRHQIIFEDFSLK